MLDIKFLKSNQEVVKNNLNKRNQPEKIKWVDEIIKDHNTSIKIKKDLDSLRHQRNIISEEINILKKQNKDISQKIQEIKQLPHKIKELEENYEHLQHNINKKMLDMPNILDKSVPTGKDETQNVVVKTWGKKTKHKFEPKSHIDLIKDLDLADLERAAKISGARFYYLKNQLVILNQAIMRFALDLAIKKGFTLIQPPYMMKKSAYQGAVSLDQFEETLYKIEGEDLFLIATAEHPLDEKHSNDYGELIQEDFYRYF